MSDPFDKLRTGGFEDQLANALGAFKMQLDARPNIPSKQTMRPSGVVTRQSSFGSQLPAPQPRPKEPLPAQKNAYVLTISGVPLFFGLDPNGTFTLTFIGADIDPDGYGEQFNWFFDSGTFTYAANYTPGLPAQYPPWHVIVFGENPTGAFYESFGYVGVEYPNVQPGGGTGILTG